jgi:hypothetical protein
MFVARLTVELLRPVPLAPLQAIARTIRPGQKVQWLEGALLADGKEVARATALRLRTADVNVSDAVQVDAGEAPPRLSVVEPSFFDGHEVGLWAAHEMLRASGSWGVAGPAKTWFRLRANVVDDEPVRPFDRVATCADFGSGVGNPLPWTNARAINPELSIHVHREPQGEWVCLDSGGFVESHGVGMAETRLFDERGPVGRAVQTLLVEPLEGGHPFTR